MKEKNNCTSVPKILKNICTWLKDLIYTLKLKIDVNTYIKKINVRGQQCISEMLRLETKYTNLIDFETWKQAGVDRVCKICHDAEY